MSIGYTMDYDYFPNTNKINTIEESYDSEDGINSMDRNSTHTFTYDENGNTTQELQDIEDINNGGSKKNVSAKRHIVWQEDNLMCALSDDNAATHFIYDGNGERVLKISEQWHKVFVNSELSANPQMEPGYTIYVNPYMTVSHDGRYTKHIFAGSDRVVSKIGNPKDYGPGDPTALGLGLPNGKRGILEGLIGKNCGELGLEITYNSQKPLTPGQPLGLTNDNDDPELLQYFFTKDHLGSSTIISNGAGIPIQHIEYTAFGETFADWRTETYDTPYRFTGKEQDSETGLYYYGARYYDPRLGRFLSVDPLAEKYGAWSPYAYVFDNPLKFNDPTGMGAETDYYDNNGKLLLHTNDGSKDAVIINDEIGFGQSIACRSPKILNSKEYRKTLEGYGTAYDVESFSNFFDSNEGDIEAQRADGRPMHINSAGTGVKVANEHATFLYKNSDGVVTIGPENIQGVSSGQIPSERLVPSKEGSVGTLHTHPAQGKGLRKLLGDGGIYGYSYSRNIAEGAPSLFDYNYHAPKNGGYSIFTTAKSHVFFNNKGHFFSIPR
ncbi:MAG: RHS repeat-associated core domain-containing protein [Saprospiraceae bacterium]